MHFVSPAGCAMHQAWSDAVGECIETGEQLHQDLGRVASSRCIPQLCQRARPYLHSIAFSIWETLLVVLDPVNLAPQPTSKVRTRPCLVNLLTLSTKRVLEGLHRLGASRNYVSERTHASCLCVCGGSTRCMQQIWWVYRLFP